LEHSEFHFPPPLNFLTSILSHPRTIELEPQEKEEEEEEEEEEGGRRRKEEGLFKANAVN